MSHSPDCCVRCQTPLPDGVGQVGYCGDCAAKVFSGGGRAQALGATHAAPQGLAGGNAAIRLDGVTCSSCAWAIEHGLAEITGLARARVDVVRKRLAIEWDATEVEPRALLESVLKRVRALGYGAWEDAAVRAADSGAASAGPASATANATTNATTGATTKAADPDDPAQVRRVSERRQLQRGLLAMLCMMQVMMLSVPVYLAEPGDIPADLDQLMRIAQLILTAPVLTFCAWPIYRAAWRDLRLGRVGMDLSVTLGLLVAGIASVFAVLTGSGEIYFDSVTMFVALLLTSRWLQSRGLQRASAYLDALAQRSMPLAQRLTGYPQSLATETVRADQLAPDDLLWVRPGETFAADGVVVSGTSGCSEALLTGESRPIEKRPGDAVLASGVNLEAPLVIRAGRVGADTALAALTRLAEAAARERPALVEFADRAARIFIGVVLLLVVIASAVWALIDPSRIVPVAVAILIVTCPCALSLAVPVALASAQAALARRGVLVTRAAAIETLGRIDHVVFDKTGTLTEGRMLLVAVHPMRDGIDAAAATKMATALGTASNHPIAVALRAAATDPLPEALEAHDARAIAGDGVEAVLDGRLMRFGRTEFVLQALPETMRSAAQEQINATMRGTGANGAPGMNGTVSVLADETGPIALLAFDDPLRPDAANLIRSLRARDLSISMLSGDRRAAVWAAAATLGLSDVRAEVSPLEKRDAVRALQDRGRIVAMVGDGLNDAPVIAQADVSAAFAGASTLAQTRADFLVLSGSLTDLGSAFTLCARALRVIRQNLAWALAYNVVAIPVAAIGFISPAWAGAGMAVSSLIVVANALRLLPARNKGAD